VSDPLDWQQANAQYLSDAVAALRARLERCATPPPAPPRRAPAPPAEEPRSFWQQLVGRGAVEQPAAALPLPERMPSGQELAEAKPKDRTTSPSPTGLPPALVILRQRLGLSQFEQEVLLLCAAMELDTGIAGLCARAQGDAGRPYPTFALALTLFDDPAWDALSPEHPLRYWRLIEINQPGGQPLTTSALRADERIVNYIKGLNYLDDRLAPLLAPLDNAPGDIDLPPSQQSVAEMIVRRLKQTPPGQSPPVVQLLGVDAASKQRVAARAAAELGLRVYRIPVPLLPTHAAELETLARLWQRESLLLPLALYLDGLETDVPPTAHGAPVNRLLGRVGGVMFLDSRDIWSGLDQDSLPVDIAKPTAAEQQAAWGVALGGAAAESPALLAGQFSLDLPSIRQIARHALAESPSGERSVHDRLWDAALAATRPRLDMLAQRIEPKVTWEDLVLPAAENDLLRQIAAQVGQRSQVYQSWGFDRKTSRGLGISALFSGDAGTGKTMAAEVIANHLRLNLYRIDLSAVVSKYIGETEKNLRRLFDAAEDGGAILFFDEADALFGKRSEVKDSHDRYANIEINYLLQRMEAYRGLAILATNMKSSLDPAFMRRLRFVVNFPFPPIAERKAIWQKVFPSEVPTVNLDFDRLARLHLSGGNIHSAALNAAFMAAEAKTPVTMPLLLDAARAELRKLGRSVNELEFRRSGATGAVA
jgi:ATPase family protein associated with various cellular activities (AAA)/winged helix domain-containing protein